MLEPPFLVANVVLFDLVFMVLIFLFLLKLSFLGF